ncbi:hypothetical protein LMG27174_05551 [Paraburkholderia rhynchosiae]|uniref:Uncharacterized protein n=1 Tax=Paraburkholderia rhynchosiae TaxID=487049 RepID=A0A6J5C8T8_9BURK|nr:hypothetical protein LMG27174_05551 [Paraburkholderia rhynchosiae]
MSRWLTSHSCIELAGNLRQSSYKIRDQTHVSHAQNQCFGMPAANAASYARFSRFAPS